MSPATSTGRKTGSLAAAAVVGGSGQAEADAGVRSKSVDNRDLRSAALDFAADAVPLSGEADLRASREHEERMLRPERGAVRSIRHPGMNRTGLLVAGVALIVVGLLVALGRPADRGSGDRAPMVVAPAAGPAPSSGVGPARVVSGDRHAPRARRPQKAGDGHRRDGAGRPAPASVTSTEASTTTPVGPTTTGSEPTSAPEVSGPAPAPAEPATPAPASVPDQEAAPSPSAAAERQFGFER